MIDHLLWVGSSFDRWAHMPKPCLKLVNCFGVIGSGGRRALTGILLRCLVHNDISFVVRLLNSCLGLHHHDHIIIPHQAIHIWPSHGLSHDLRSEVP